MEAFSMLQTELKAGRTPDENMICGVVGSVAQHQAKTFLSLIGGADVSNYAALDVDEPK